MARARITGILLSAACLLGQPAQDLGVIKGQVVYPDGTPVNAARVLAQIPGAPMGMIARYVHTDDQGNFVIDRLAFGRYALYASKEEEQYQDPRHFSTIDPPRVTISAEQPVGTAVVTFGPKAGLISGTVRDAVTGRPLEPHLLVRRPNDPWFFSSSTLVFHYHLLVPTSTELTLEVSSPGYEPWTYSQPLRLAAGSELRLDVELTPHPDFAKLAKFLIPAGYRGAVQVLCELADQPAMPLDAGGLVYRFGTDGNLKTSSACPSPGSQNTYFYYFADGSSRAIAEDYWHGNGLVWGEHGSLGSQTQGFGFLVGTEAEYLKLFPDDFRIY